MLLLIERLTSCNSDCVKNLLLPICFCIATSTRLYGVVLSKLKKFARFLQGLQEDAMNSGNADFYFGSIIIIDTNAIF